jgi:predicted methyltransferase
MPPLLTLKVHEMMTAALRAGAATLECSLDLDRSMTSISLSPSGWMWEANQYPYLDQCKERTVYYWNGKAFETAARYAGSLIKLVPTEWGAPTFEIDGIKMLPTSQLSPFVDAERKVALIKPRGKVVLDTCGGLGYFAVWCLRGQAARILSYEKNPNVLWLRTLNPWSPQSEDDPQQRLTVTQGDIAEQIHTHTSDSVDAILHDPPRFGIAGELYSQAFYDQLARVLRRKGTLFHYTGTPNRLTSGRDVPNEVAIRLRNSGFNTRMIGDGVLAKKAG